jgi:hypothetical protein
MREIGELREAYASSVLLSRRRLCVRGSMHASADGLRRSGIAPLALTLASRKTVHAEVT